VGTKSLKSRQGQGASADKRIIDDNPNHV